MTRASAALLVAGLVIPSGAFAQSSSWIVSAPYDAGRVPPAVLLAQNRELQVSRLVQLPPTPSDSDDAREVRLLLQQLLAQHPPSVRAVFQADPSLLQDPDYLARYPRLQAFVAQHPEVASAPVYFFGQPFSETPPDATAQERAQQRALGVMHDLLIGLIFLIVGVTAVVVVAALLRQALDYRRWVRQSRVQTEVHSKILDRMQSNEDLLAYIQTPAGQRFLESGPNPLEAEPSRVAAPLSRILWSVQAGMILSALGVGLWIIQGNVMDEIAPAFHAMGVIALMLGLGTILSAAASYVLSKRLGLLAAQKG